MPEHQFHFPFKLDIELSTQKVVIGDTITIDVVAKFDKANYNYNAEDKYVIINPNKRGIYHFYEWKIPPEKLEETMNKFYSKYKDKIKKTWEIIYADEDVFLDSVNEKANYKLKIVILEKPKYKYFKIAIEFIIYEKIIEYAGHTLYVKDTDGNRAYFRRDYYDIIMEYDDPNLKERAYYRGLPKKPMTISDELPNIDAVDMGIFKPEMETKVE